MSPARVGRLPAIAVEPAERITCTYRAYLIERATTHWLVELQTHSFRAGPSKFVLMSPCGATDDSEAALDALFASAEFTEALRARARLGSSYASIGAYQAQDGWVLI